MFQNAENVFNIVGFIANILALFVMFMWLFGGFKFTTEVQTVSVKVPTKRVKLIIEPKNEEQLGDEFASMEIDMQLVNIPNIGEKMGFIKDPGECDEDVIPTIIGDNINDRIYCLDRDDNIISGTTAWKQFILNNAFEIKDVHHRPDAIYLFGVQI